MNLIYPDSHFIYILLSNRSTFPNHISANLYLNHDFASNLSVSFFLSPSLSHCLSICVSVSLFLYYHLSCHDTYLAKPCHVYFLFFFSFIFISWRLITWQCCSGFCHTLTWISHGFSFLDWTRRLLYAYTIPPLCHERRPQPWWGPWEL